MEIVFDQAKFLLKEGDILLFRAGGFPSIGWFISRYGGGTYSHVAVVHWDDGELYCVEQREFIGGRSILLKSQVDKFPGKIDVFRVSSTISIPKYSRLHEEVKVCKKEFTPEIAKKVVREILHLTGQPYSWSTIWQIVKAYLPFIRLKSLNLCDFAPINSFICSTAIAYGFRKKYADLVHNLPDNRVKPNDVSRSAITNYLFTIM